MAKGRGGRGPSRMDLRRQGEAAEARERTDTEELEDEEEVEDEESDDEEEGEGDDEAGEADAEADPEIDGDGDADDDEAPKKAKAKKKAAVKKAPAKPRKAKAAKIVRQRAVWKVFDNGGKVVGTFAFSQKAEAEALLNAKVIEKEGKTTFYLQLIKEAIEE